MVYGRAGTGYGERDAFPGFARHSPNAAIRCGFAEVDDQIAGWLSFREFIPRSAYRGTSEVSVYVGEPFRRGGIARRLLEKAIERAPALRLHTLVGLIFAHNEPSLQLFAQLVFNAGACCRESPDSRNVERDLTIVGRHLASPA